MRPGLESAHQSQSDHAEHQSGYQKKPHFKERVSKILQNYTQTFLSSKDVYESEGQFS